MTGTYILVIRLDKRGGIEVGRLGAFTFPKGHYLYVGSAFGPGGLNARIRRHLRTEKKFHWHIDYLTSIGTTIDVWFSNHLRRYECSWTKRLEGVPSLQHPVPGFGSSDCSCTSHLFYSRQKPLFENYRKFLTGGIREWTEV